MDDGVAHAGYPSNVWMDVMSLDEIAAVLHLAGCPLTTKQYSALIDELMGKNKEEAKRQREKFRGLIASGIINPKLY